MTIEIWFTFISCNWWLQKPQYLCLNKIDFVQSWSCLSAGWSSSSCSRKPGDVVLSWQDQPSVTVSWGMRENPQKQALKKNTLRPKVSQSVHLSHQPGLELLNMFCFILLTLVHCSLFPNVFQYMAFWSLNNKQSHLALVKILFSCARLPVHSTTGLWCRLELGLVVN